MPGIVIRDAQPRDRDQIREVTLAAFEQYSAVMPHSNWEEYRASIVETLANATPAEQIVAEQDGEIVGTVLLYPKEIVLDLSDETSIRVPTPEIRLLAVAPHARRQGVGESLLFECIRRARNWGASAITLHTLDLMQDALRLYESVGFSRDPVVAGDHYYFNARLIT